MCTIRTTGCCAVLELVDISTENLPEDMLRRVLPTILELTKNGTKPKPFIYYTGVLTRVKPDHTYTTRTDDYGQDLTEYIQEQNLGSVIDTLPPSPNWTGNEVKMWIWQPNYPAMLRWNTEHAPKPTVTQVANWDYNRTAFQIPARFSTVAEYVQYLFQYRPDLETQR